MKAGLCDTCRHQRLVTTARSAFSLCGLSTTDDRYPKYPRLPVVSCLAWDKIVEAR